MPFSSKIRRLLALFGLAAFAVVFAASALYESRKFKAELSGIMQALAAASGSLLHESIVQHRRAINEILAAVPAGDEAAVCRYFTENLPLLGPEDCYFILNSAGVVVHASRRASDFIGLDFSHLPYLHSKEEISGVHQSLATLKPVVTLTYPLPAGWIMLVERDLFSLAPLVGHLKLVGLVEGGFFFILSDSGTVVYHPDERLVANRHPLGFDLREWSEADSYGLREYTYRGKRYLCLRQPLAAPRGWVFYAAVPRQEFLRFVGIHLVYQAMAIAVLFGILGGLLHILIDRKVSKPIQCLAAHLSTFNPLQDAAGCDPVAGEDAAELNQIVAACERMAANIRAANEQLRGNEALFRTVTEFASDWSYWLDPEEKVVYVSPSCELITGYTAAEFYAEPALMRKLVHPEDRELVLAHVPQAVQDQPHAPLEFRIVAKDGTVRWLSHICRPIRDAEGNFLGVRGSNTDITEQRRLEQELCKAYKLESLGVLAGGIAHDFNNLLTAIIGNLSMARSDAPGGAMRRQLEAAEKAALRAQGLTKQLLTFAKGGAPIKAVASIADLVREAAEFLLHGAKTRHTMTSPPDLWAVEVDAAQMSQVVNNLILNADQAMPGGGTIAISLTNRHLDAGAGLPLPPGPYVEIRVADQGHGIAPDHLERIFDPYFSTKQTGSGLGLASSYSIIKRHGGHIAVESRPGEGAVFTVYLPAQPDQAVPESAGEPGQPLPGQGRVLVLDDEEMLRELALAVLERLGYEADCAEEGGQALSMYQAAQAAGRPYDVVIMDLTIPGGMGGQEAIKELLRLDPLARAIVSSGYAQDPVMANYRDYGFAAVLAKPYSVEALSRVLHDILVGGCTE